MNVGFDPDVERFRAQVAEFLQDWRDLDGFFGQGLRWPRAKQLFQALGSRGWLSLCWPQQAGGAGRPIPWEYVLWDEVAYARAPRRSPGAPHAG